MRLPEDLPAKQLEDIVSAIQSILWRENSDWNPDKIWSSETTDDIATVLILYHLDPDSH